MRPCHEKEKKKWIGREGKGAAGRENRVHQEMAGLTNPFPQPGSKTHCVPSVRLDPSTLSLWDSEGRRNPCLYACAAGCTVSESCLAVFKSLSQKSIFFLTVVFAFNRRRI